MSDFTSDFWSLFVSGITIAGILACFALLWISGKTKAMTAADNTTGHIWDGDLREMNNPLPRWWVWLFIITLLFSMAYLWMYPGLGSSAGAASRAQRRPASSPAAALAADRNAAGESRNDPPRSLAPSSAATHSATFPWTSKSPHAFASRLPTAATPAKPSSHAPCPAPLPNVHSARGSSPKLYAVRVPARAPYSHSASVGSRYPVHPGTAAAPS